MQRLSGLDSAFLSFETPTMHMHVCGLVLVDTTTMPGGYSFARVRQLLDERVQRIPGMRRRLAPVPFDLSHPYWVADDAFDLDYHLRRIAVPAPGGDHELAEVVGDIASRPLDRARPLWEMWIAEGLASGEIALVVKMHHSTIDGVSGANLMFHLFDLEPDPAPRPPAEESPWTPERRPGELELLARGALDTVGRPFGVARLLPSTLLRVGKLLVRRGREGRPGMATPFTAPRTSFNATLTPHRKVAFTHVPLGEVKRVKDATGVKVNDVVLAVCAGALRRYLHAGGELPERPLLAAIPVSVHDRAADRPRSHPGTNKVSCMFATLATDIDDPLQRLEHIAAANEAAKEEHELVGANTLQDWAEHAAPNTFSLAARVYSSLRFADRHPVVHNVIISNVPGPPIPLYFAGGRLVGLYPLGPILDGAGLNITVLSLEDTVGVGFIACRELMPRLWELAEAVPEALAELLAAAVGTPPQRSVTRSGRSGQ